MRGSARYRRAVLVERRELNVETIEGRRLNRSSFFRNTGERRGCRGGREYDSFVGLGWIWDGRD